MKLDHIGIVVEDVSTSLEYYLNLYQTSVFKPEYLEPAHDVKIIFLNAGDKVTTKIELISPINQKSKVFNFLKKNGGGFHHTAFLVEDLETSIKYFKNINSLILGKPNPAAGHNNKPSVWIYNSDKSLIELIEY